jgi:hypothetical protein
MLVNVRHALVNPMEKHIDLTRITPVPMIPQHAYALSSPQKNKPCLTISIKEPTTTWYHPDQIIDSILQSAFSANKGGSKRWRRKQLGSEWIHMKKMNDSGNVS